MSETLRDMLLGIVIAAVCVYALRSYRKAAAVRRRREMLKELTKRGISGF